MKLTNVIVSFGIIYTICLNYTLGYTIPSVDGSNNDIAPDNDDINPLDYEDVTNLEDGGRDKRQVVEYDREVVFSPNYGYGYYVFPRSTRREDFPRREFEPRRRSAPVHKRKKLFVPNLFG